MFRIKRSLADKLFSDFIREKADYACERCKVEFERPAKTLHCSHYHSRRNKSTRWDMQNACSLCFSCHRHFTENPHEHGEFFKKRLGEKDYEALAARARIPQRIDEKIIVLFYKEQLKMLKENRRVLK